MPTLPSVDGGTEEMRCGADWAGLLWVLVPLESKIPLPECFLYAKVCTCLSLNSLQPFETRMLILSLHLGKLSLREIKVTYPRSPAKMLQIINGRIGVNIQVCLQPQHLHLKCLPTLTMKVMHIH